MARTGPLLTEAQWKKIAPCSRNRRSIAGVAARGLRIVACWKGFSGFCGAVLAGRICRRNIRILRRAGDDCGIGRSKGFG